MDDAADPVDNDIHVENSPQHADARRPKTDVTSAEPPAPPAARPAAVWTWWLLRLGVTTQALLACTQPILAGRFLSGDFSMLSLHRSNGTFVGVVTMVQIVTTLLAWILGRAPFGLFAAALGLGAATALQLFTGFNHLLGLHIPLGVAIVALDGWLVVWVWRHGPGVLGGRGSRERRQTRSRA